MKMRVWAAAVVVALGLAACGGAGGTQGTGTEATDGAVSEAPLSEDASEDAADPTEEATDEATEDTGSEQGQEVAVAAVEPGPKKYDFEFDQPVPAGPTTFVLSNEGKEPHFMFVVQMKEPGTLQDALDADKNGENPDKYVKAEIGGTKPIKPGSGKTQEMTGDLEPGSYAMLCFISSKDKVPHAYRGMAVEFEVQ